MPIQFANDQLGSNAVDSRVLVDGAVGTTKIPDGAITSAKLAGGVTATVLGGKLAGRFVQIPEQASPNAATANVKTLIFGGANAVDPEGNVKGKAALIEAANGVEFNTTTGKVGSAAKARSIKMVCVDVNGDAIIDAQGKKVWAVITCSSATRLNSGSFTARFFSGEFGSGNEAAYTMNQAFTFAYPQIFDLSDMPVWDDATVAMIDEEAAQLAPGQITTALLADLGVTTGKLADLGVTTGKIADLGVTTAKIADLGVTNGKLAADSVSGDKIANGGVGAGKYGAGSIATVDIADNAVSTAKIGGAQVTTAKIAGAAITEALLDPNGAIQREQQLVMDDNISSGGYVPGAPQDAQGAVTALASPGMAVRIQTSHPGVYNNSNGVRKSVPTNANIAIGAADATNPRIDVVVLDAGGAIQVRAGTPATPAMPPVLSQGDVSLAQIDVAANATTIQSGNIKDFRNRQPIAGSKLRTMSVSPLALMTQNRSLLQPGDNALTKVSLTGPTIQQSPGSFLYFGVYVYRNGGRIKNVTPNVPSGLDEYRVIEESNTTKVELGAALPTGQSLLVDWSA